MKSGRADRRRFAAKLRRLRDLNGKMTQEELHYAPGVPLDLAQNYKQEKSLAKGDAAERLAKALHVSSAAFYAVEMDNMKELDEAAPAIRRMGGALEGMHDYTVPGTDIVHRVVRIRKTSPTPAKYPRRFAKIQTEPIR